MASGIKLFSGRKRESTTWKYFEFHDDTNKTVCKVVSEKDNNVCGFPLSGKNTTNLKTHLQRYHPLENESYVKAVAEESLSKTSGKIQRLHKKRIF